jgi:hypothetical protein
MSHGASSPLRRTFPVPGGPPVRLRLAGPSDLPAVRALLERRGVETDDLTLRRLLAFDPSRRHVLAAFAPLGGQDTLVGVAPSPTAMTRRTCSWSTSASPPWPTSWGACSSSGPGPAARPEPPR